MIVPPLRIRTLSDKAVQNQRQYVLYWMTSCRRGEWNFGLQRAVEWAVELKKPLVVLEALRCDYRWASDRIHQFMIEGMVDNATFFKRKPVTYYPYVEPVAGAGKGLLQALGQHACVVIGDDFPCFFLPRMVSAADKQVDVRFELVDSNGLLPMRSTERVFARAFDFRRYLQRNLPEHLDAIPESSPLTGLRIPRQGELPAKVQQRWPPLELSPNSLSIRETCRQLPIDHTVAPSSTAGGTRAAARTLRTFLSDKLTAYSSDRNQPQRDVTSGLSPYLHAGHISAHQIFAEITALDGWSISHVSSKANGSSHGWWGTSEPVESFLDELITWRELGYNMCSHRTDFDQFESLPEWSQRTLAEHAEDSRTHIYSLSEFEAAETHDPLWNAAQNQLLQEGRIHNYLRMLWGKKVLEWSATPQDALQTLIELNNKYALDGRNPNSYSGIFWCFGRYDRAWGPERPIYGKVRYMSSDNTARKVRVRDYISHYNEGESRLF